MEALIRDLRFALRRLVRRPGVSLAMLLTLGLGIGANTAIFSVINSMLLQPLPFADVDRLVQVQRAFQGSPAPNVSARQYVWWDDRSLPFERVVPYSWLPMSLTLGGEGRPQRLEAYRVRFDYFELFGTHPSLGRGFSPEEDTPGGPAVVILSHQLWVRLFGADEDLVGCTLQLNGLIYEVVGVMPPEFRFPVTADLWMPLQLDRLTEDRFALLTVTAKLEEGYTPRMAQEMMAPVTEEYLNTHGDPNRQETIAVQPLAVHLYGSLRTHFLMLAGCVAFVLLVACANVANLQLARSGERRRELATRLALGTGPARLVRGLLIENLLLALLGGLVGLVFARLSFSPLLAALPDNLQRFHEVELDLTVLVFTFVLAALVGTATGLVPGLGTWQVPVSEALKEGGARSGSGRARHRTSLFLAASQITLTVISMIGAMLLVKNYVSLVRTDSGIDSDNVAIVKVALSAADYGTGERWGRLSSLVLPEIQRLPGVGAAAATSVLPMTGGPPMSFLIAGRDPEEPNGFGNGQFFGVSPGYFDLLGIGLLKGRTFTQQDDATAHRVVVINQALKRQVWPDENPLGQQITLGPPILPALGDDAARTVIGVVADVREWGFAQPPPPALYVPLGQLPDPFAASSTTFGPLGLMVRTSASPASLVKQVEEALWKFDSELPVFDPMWLEDYMARDVGPQYSLMNLVSLFAILALLLSAVGIYGVLSYLVVQRTHEIGVRVAFGADQRRIVRLILWQGMRAVFAGIALGVATAAILSRTIAGFIVINPLDPTSYVAVALFFALTAMGATSLPAYRAARVRPSQALRFE